MLWSEQRYVQTYIHSYLQYKSLSPVSLSDVFYYENGNFTVACTAVKPCSYVNLESTVLSSCNCDICSVQYNRSDLLPTCTECSFMEMSNSSHFAAVVSCKAMKHTSELSCKCDDDSVSTTICKLV